MPSVHTGKDLGTYWVRAEFADGTGFWLEYNTGGRFTHGSEGVKPLTAQWMPPSFDDEEQLIGTIHYQFTDGNYSCDCNRSGFIAQAHQVEDDERSPCGNTMQLVSLLVQTPDGRRIPLGTEGFL